MNRPIFFLCAFALGCSGGSAQDELGGSAPDELCSSNPEAAECQGDIEPPTILNTDTPLCVATSPTTLEVLFYLSTDDITAFGRIEYGVYYGNPREADVPSGAISASEVVALAERGVLKEGRPFGAVTGGTFDGRIVFELAEELPIVEPRIVARDEAGNMTAYPPCRVTF